MKRIAENVPLDDQINAVAAQVDGYTAMLSGKGWKDLQAEIDLWVAEKQDLLQTCELDKVRELQGNIAAFKWLMGHFEEVAEHLEVLQKVLKESKEQPAE